MFLLLGRDPTVPASFNRITKGPGGGGGGIDDRAPRDPWIGAIASPREIWLSLVFFSFFARALKFDETFLGIDIFFYVKFHVFSTRAK